MKFIITSSLIIEICFLLGFCLLGLKAENGVQLIPSNTRQLQDVTASCTEHDCSGQLPRVNSAKSAPSELKLVKRGRQGWTRREEQRLLNLREQEMSWKEISRFFPERRWTALRTKYHRLTNAEDKHDRAKLWTDEEKKLLLELKKGNTSWADIAEFFPERGLKSVQSQYTFLTRSPPLSAPQVVVQHYTAEEDELLLELAKAGVPWKQRLAYFEDRSLASIRTRYTSLRRKQGKSSPRATPKSFTPEEDDFIIKAVESGTGLTEIGRLLGRKRGSIRSRILILENLNRLDPARPKENGIYYTAADLELIHTMADKGMSWEDIATKYFPSRSATGIRLALKYHTEKENLKTE